MFVNLIRSLVIVVSPLLNQFFSRLFKKIWPLFFFPKKLFKEIQRTGEFSVYLMCTSPGKLDFIAR